MTENSNMSMFSELLVICMAHEYGSDIYVADMLGFYIAFNT